METNKGDKRLLFAGLLVSTLAYLVYDYYTNPCSFYNQNFLIHHKVIDKKYVYYFNNDKIVGVYHIFDCKNIRLLNNYYNNYNENISLDIGNGINYMRINISKYEILKYDYKDSIAFIKIYNTSPRMVKEDYTIVSMKCLHDTLPTGYKEYVP